MKKLILLWVLLVAGPVISHAQEKGQMWIGGSIGVSTSKKNDVKATSFTILPELGYQFAKRWGAGMTIGYARAQDHYSYMTNMDDGRLAPQIYTATSNEFISELFVRYAYFKRNVCILFLDGGAGYTNRIAKQDSDQIRDGSFQLFSAGIRPGIGINLSPNFTLTGQFGFVGYEYKKNDYYKGSAFTANFQLNSIYIGLIGCF